MQTSANACSSFCGGTRLQVSKNDRNWTGWQQTQDVVAIGYGHV